MVVFSAEREVGKFSKAEEYQGKLQMQLLDDKLMHSVLEDDQKTIDDGKIIENGINQGMSAFVPNMMFENLVKNFSIAKQLYGEKLLRLIVGYDPKYLEKAPPSLSPPANQASTSSFLYYLLSKTRIKEVKDFFSWCFSRSG